MILILATADFALSYGLIRGGARVWTRSAGLGRGKFRFSGPEFCKIPPPAAQVAH
ncbi:hypothetical protein Z947_1816 [Sulfitobacter geojensis]|nr:hypothetical protein Z947_1816 [Sulfitobacter geojensis]